MTKKESFFVSLFNSLFFGILYTFAGSVINQQSINWPNVPAQILVGVIVGIVVGMLIPAGKWGGMLGAKLAKPGSLLFKFIMYNVILIVMLIFMCPALTVFIASVQGGAPVMAVLPASYNLFIPFYLVGIVAIMIFGDLITAAAMKCAHLGQKQESK